METRRGEAGFTVYYRKIYGWRDQGFISAHTWTFSKRKEAFFTRLDRCLICRIFCLCLFMKSKGITDYSFFEWFYDKVFHGFRLSFRLRPNINGRIITASWTLRWNVWSSCKYLVQAIAWDFSICRIPSDVSEESAYLLLKKGWKADNDRVGWFLFLFPSFLSKKVFKFRHFFDKSFV